MINMNERITIKELLKKWHSKCQIAKIVGCHRNTVSSIAKEKDLKERPKSRKDRHYFDDYKELIKIKIKKGLSIKRIHEDLVRKHGCQKSYDSLQKYIKSRKLKVNRIYQVICTEPWEEVQIDFGYVWYLKDKDGNNRKAWVFVMVQWYSRKWFHKIVFSQDVPTFIKCHIEWFEYFWWVPKTVRIDNLKSAILEANFYEPKVQKDYLNFSKHYGFWIYNCKVRCPEEKWKVESGVKYVKWSFFKSRTFKDIREAEQELYKWQEEICNKRKHGTTRNVPDEVFLLEEKDSLQSLPDKKREICSIEYRRVDKTCHIMVDKNYYSVPYKYAQDKVRVAIYDNIIKVYDSQDCQIAIHTRSKQQWRHITDEKHYGENVCMEEETFLEKMKSIWDYAYKYGLKLKEKNQNNWTRSIKWILGLKSTYKNKIIDKACKRLLKYKTYSYDSVKKVCSKKLYKEEKLNETKKVAGRFLRDKWYYLNLMNIFISIIILIWK